MIPDKTSLNLWYPVARAKDVPDGKVLQFRLLGEDVVVWRANGKLSTFKDLCVHRGAKLSLGWVDGENLVCKYHGFTYDGDGACVRIPAQQNLKPPPTAHALTYHVQEAYDLVWVCMGDIPQRIPELPFWDESSFTKVLVGPYHVNASAPRLIENALDIAHFPFTHMGVLGDPKYPEVLPYEVEVGDDGITASNVRVRQMSVDATGSSNKMVNYTYRIYNPFTMAAIKNPEGSDTRRMVIWSALNPVNEAETISYTWVLMNYGHEVPDFGKKVKEREDIIFGQDIPVTESQRPELLPLDLQAELSLRADLTSIAYRKWLKKLGISFGTS